MQLTFIEGAFILRPNAMKDDVDQMYTFATDNTVFKLISTDDWRAIQEHLPEGFQLKHPTRPDANLMTSLKKDLELALGCHRCNPERHSNGYYD
jgi:hypothetical protein